MELDADIGLVIVRVALALGALIAWYLLYKWTERGTAAGLAVNRVTTLAHQMLLTAYGTSAIVNGVLNDSKSLVLTIIRHAISLTVITSLVAWLIAEKSRRGRP